jgi:hypothetical protein
MIDVKLTLCRCLVPFTGPQTQGRLKARFENNPLLAGYGSPSRCERFWRRSTVLSRSSSEAMEPRRHLISIWVRGQFEPDNRSVRRRPGWDFKFFGLLDRIVG